MFRIWDNDNLRRVPDTHTGRVPDTTAEREPMNLSLAAVAVVPPVFETRQSSMRTAEEAHSCIPATAESAG